MATTTPYLESFLSGHHDVVMGVTMTWTCSIVMFLMIIICNISSVMSCIMIKLTKQLTQMDKSDQDKVHDLLQHVDHQEASQHQDLCHRKSRVWKCSRFYRCCSYLLVVYNL